MENRTLSHAELAQEILNGVGGSENVISFMSCMTRLRVEFVDKNKVDVDYLKSLDKVKGVQITGTFCQIILFAELEKTYNEFEKIVKVTNKEIVAKKSIVDTILNFTSSVFVPIIPPIIACGLVLGLVGAIDFFHLMDTTSTTYRILSFVGNTALYYYPVLIAFSAAKYLKMNQYLTVIIALIMVNPSFIALSNEALEAGQNFISFFGIPLRAVNYTSSVFPMFCAIWGVYVIEKLVYKYIPETVKTALAPFLVVIISLPVCLGVLAPIGSFLNDGFVVAFSTFYHEMPVLAGAVIGALGLVMVMLGIHQVNGVLAFANLAAFGYDVIWPILHYSTVIAGIVGIMVALRIKNKEEKPAAMASGLTALVFGITEPVIYGVLVRNKKAFASVIVCGALIGVASMVIGVHCTGIGANGVFAWPTYFTTISQFFICYGLCYVITIPVTFYLGAGKDELTK